MKKVIVLMLLAAILLTSAVFAEEVKNGEPGQQQVIAKVYRSNRRTNDPLRNQRNIMRMHQRMKNHLMSSFFLMPIIQRRLSLTDAQVDKLEMMKADYQKKMIDRRAQISKVRVDLKMATRKMSMDVNKIQRLIQTISGLETDMKVARYKAFEQAKSVLTADQKTTLQGMWDGKMTSRRMKDIRIKKMKTRSKMKGEATPDNDVELGLLEVVEDEETDEIE